MILNSSFSERLVNGDGHYNTAVATKSVGTNHTRSQHTPSWGGDAIQCKIHGQSVKWGSGSIVVRSTVNIGVAVHLILDMMSCMFKETAIFLSLTGSVKQNLSVCVCVCVCVRVCMRVCVYVLV